MLIRGSKIYILEAEIRDFLISFHQKTTENDQWQIFESINCSVFHKMYKTCFLKLQISSFIVLFWSFGLSLFKNKELIIKMVDN